MSKTNSWNMCLDDLMIWGIPGISFIACGVILIMFGMPFWMPFIVAISGIVLIITIIKFKPNDGNKDTGNNYKNELKTAVRIFLLLPGIWFVALHASSLFVLLTALTTLCVLGFITHLVYKIAKQKVL